MKSLLQKGISMMFALIFLTLNSCKDPCEDVTCLNGGACMDGTCLCEEYYNGQDCEEYVLEKYAGKYVGTHFIDGESRMIICDIESEYIGLNLGELKFCPENNYNLHFLTVVDASPNGDFIINTVVPRPFNLPYSLESIEVDSIKGSGRFEGVKMEGSAIYYMETGEEWATTFDFFKQ